MEKGEIILEAQQFLEGLVRATGLRLDVSCRVEDDPVLLDLSGPDAELVLEDNARLLYSLNHLLNQAYFRRSNRACSFLLDCNEYRSTRTMELELLARKAAEEVRKSGVPFSLQPMPAGERRVIHLALAEESGVVTESSGTGPNRHVVIVASSR